MPIVVATSAVVSITSSGGGSLRVADRNTPAAWACAVITSAAVIAAVPRMRRLNPACMTFLPSGSTAAGRLRRSVARLGEALLPCGGHGTWPVLESFIQLSGFQEGITAARAVDVRKSLTSDG